MFRKWEIFKLKCNLPYMFLDFGKAFAQQNQIIFIYNMKYTFLILLVMVVVSCDDDNNQNCSGNLVCTEEFRTVLIDVVDGDGAAITLDSFTATNLDTNTSIDLQSFQGIDGYPIADDSMLNEIPREGQQIEFVGILNGEQVAKETFLVGHDCCHVIVLEGNTTIEISL